MKDRIHLFLPNALKPMAFCAIAALGLACVQPVAAQTGAAAPVSAAQARRDAQRQSQLQQASSAPSEKDVADIQDQMLKLLRLSPILTSVVARDPSLLSDQEYVARNNPELAQYMTVHPDISKNPEFYLFSHLEQGKGRRDQALERAVWPDLAPVDRYGPTPTGVFLEKLTPIILVPLFFFAVVWVIRLFVEGHRWSRTFKQQSEVHARLIDKFSTNQELAAYMDTEAGKRFLEMSPVASGGLNVQHMPNAVARVLTPLQVGVVLTLLGAGILLLRHAGPDMVTPMTVLGTMVLMPGIGFILSAGATWVLAQRLGLLPEKAAAHAALPFGSPDRQ